MLTKCKAFQMFSVSAVLVFALTIISASATAIPFAVAWQPWGPHFYTPDQGRFIASSEGFAVQNLTWSSGDIDRIQMYFLDESIIKTIEFECRPYSNNPGAETTPVDPNAMWYNEKSKIKFTSNLPDAFYEFQSTVLDGDDVSIGVGNADLLVAGTKYSGTLSLTAKPNITFTNRRVLFESEFGAKSLFDSVPIYYEQYNNTISDSNVLAANTYFGSFYSWP